MLLITEGTYPFVMGGVSTWCDVLVSGLRGVTWQVLPITAGGVVRERRFALPSNAHLVAHLDLWADTLVTGRPPVLASSTGVPAALARDLLSWETDPGALLEVLDWCHRYPTRIRAEFRRASGWLGFLNELEGIAEQDASHSGPVPRLNALEASELFQALYWAARSAALPTPARCDVVLSTAAGWGSIVAALHRRRHGVPTVLAEHGVYVREAYLGQVRANASPGTRWGITRLARGLARLGYATADVVAPVTQANVPWELRHGADPERIRVIYNGVLVPTHVDPPPQTRHVVTIGRVDPLKDVLTMLRVAAHVVERDAGVRFSHFGPYGDPDYFEECLELHRRLHLGDKFRFCGPTDQPDRELASADVSLLTSRSEGFPISVLEAMASGRPVVATSVGGVAEAVGGCGFLAPPGDVEALGAGVLALVGDPALAERLGRRGRARVVSRFGQSACLEAYRQLFEELTGASIAAADPPADLVAFLPGPDDADDTFYEPELPRLLVPGRLRRLTSQPEHHISEADRGEVTP